MINNKKVRERKLLDEVIQIFPGFPPAEIIEAESPDFLIRKGIRVIGIELVDYMRGQNEGESAERRNEVLWQKIADKAKNEFEARHSDPLMVHFIWNHRYFLRQSEIPQLADDATKLVETHIPERLFEQIRIGSDELEGTLLEDICNSITVTRARNSEQILWSFISSGFIGVQAEELQKLIDSKNDKVQEYLRHCKEVWLIIVADGHYISSSIDLPQLTSDNVYASNFEQVLVYDRIKKCVHQLRIRHT